MKIKYNLELLEGPTDNPIKIIRLKDYTSRTLLIDSIPWKIISLLPWKHRNLIDEELLDFCFNYKDNPVPSLDIIDYENLLYLCEQAAHKPGLAGKQVYINLYNKLNIIQNGVETNKEQPKEYCKAKSELNRPTDYKNCDCHNFCKYDNIQFDTSLG